MDSSNFFNSTTTISNFKPHELVAHIYARLEKEKTHPGTSGMVIDHDFKMVVIDRIVMAAASEFNGHENLLRNPQFETVSAALKVRNWRVQSIQHQLIVTEPNDYSVSSNPPKLHGFTVAMQAING
jgi:hypothetical protein